MLENTKLHCWLLITDYVLSLHTCTGYYKHSSVVWSCQSWQEWAFSVLEQETSLLQQYIWKSHWNYIYKFSLRTKLNAKHIHSDRSHNPAKHTNTKPTRFAPNTDTTRPHHSFTCCQTYYHENSVSVLPQYTNIALTHSSVKGSFCYITSRFIAAGQFSNSVAFTLSTESTVNWLFNHITF
jgi:hypothetical protein